jgi:hypothetical protein
MRRFPWGPAGLLAACLVASPLPASACSCTNNLTTQQEFDYAYAVFSGRELSIQPNAYGQLAVEFQPIERWKGPIDYVQFVATPPNPAVCGYNFVVGQEYLVFVTITYVGITYTPEAFTHLCSRTSPLEGNPYLGELPPPLLPVPVSRPAWGTLKVRYR